MRDAYVVLEGGGVRGSALAGAMSVAVKHLNILGIAGTSAGAIVASLYAAGYTPDELKTLMVEAPFKKFRDVRVLPQLVPLLWWFSPGYCRGRYFYRWIKEQISSKFSNRLVTFGDLKLPLKVVAADLTNREMVVFDHTQNIEVAEAVRMSMSIPLFFQAYSWGQRVMVDGGIVSNFPVWIFDEEIKQSGRKDVYTVGFNLQERERGGRPVKNLGEILTATLDTSMTAREELITRLSTATVCFIPTGDVRSTDFDISVNQRIDLFDRGKLAAENFFLKWEQEQEDVSSLSARFVTYASREEALLQLIAELEQALREKPQDKERLLRDIEITVSQLLALSVAITDDPNHGLSANFMTYVPDEKKLVITHSSGMYARWRVHREFFPERPAQAGSCGRAFKEKQIIIIPDSEQEPSMWLPHPDERRLLRGVINIPVPSMSDAGEILGVVNIDSPIPDIFSKQHLTKAMQIERYMARILNIRREFLSL